MIPKTKEYVAARRQAYRATEALKSNSGDPKLILDFEAAHARLGDAAIEAIRNPQNAGPDDAPADPSEKHHATAERWLSTAEKIRDEYLKAREATVEANRAQMQMRRHAENYTLAEIREAEAKLQTTLKIENRLKGQMDRATTLSARAMARAEGAPPHQRQNPIAEATQAKREARWKRTEQRLARVETVWRDRLARATADLEAPRHLKPAAHDRKAQWQERCTRMHRMAAARLAAYRRDHGLATPAAPAPEQPDPLEKDEHGNYIL